MHNIPFLVEVNSEMYVKISGFIIIQLIQHCFIQMSVWLITIVEEHYVILFLFASEINKLIKVLVNTTYKNSMIAFFTLLSL